jgi:Xaa-Pro dipeptidase
MFPHHERRTRLIEAFPDTIDALLVTRLINVAYLTGFTGSNGALLVPRVGTPVIATDSRYAIQVTEQAPDLECIDARAVGSVLVERAGQSGVRRLGVEAKHVTLASYDALQGAAGDGITLVATGPLVEALRAVKDDSEIAALTTACEITDAAFATVTASLRAGVAEAEVAWQLATAVREHGGSGMAFDSIVAFGPNSAIPHHEPTDRPLGAGELVKLDFGARYAGYHADMTRTVVLTPAADWQRDVHAEVLAIQAASRAACVVGAVPRDLDAGAAAAIEATGHRVFHGLGHGVGLEIHEDPFLTSGSVAGPLAESAAVTVEPGIYLPGQGGVRIEDTVVIDAGGARSLTQSARDLREVG